MSYTVKTIDELGVQPMARTLTPSRPGATYQRPEAFRSEVHV